jgi:hypothetical protein
VRDEDKVWTDPAAEARARKMGREALEKRLQEIGLEGAEYSAYLRYSQRVASEVTITTLLFVGLFVQENKNRLSLLRVLSNKWGVTRGA